MRSNGADDGELDGVGDDDFDPCVGVRCAGGEGLQEARAVRMNFHGGDCCAGIVIGDGKGFAAGGGAAVEDAGMSVRSCSPRSAATSCEPSS